MVVNVFTIQEKICTVLDAASASNVIPLFTYVPYSKSGFRVLDESLSVENLRAVSWIYNTAPVEFPIFPFDASESEQLFTTINLEWTSPRIQLDLLFKLNSSNSWQKIDSYSLLNQSPYPYRQFSLGNHPLGSNSMLGLQIVDVTYGILKNSSAGNDKVVILGELNRKLSVQEIIDNSTKIVNNITATPATIINSNPNRKALTFFNSSTFTIYIDTVSSVSTTSYLARLIPGAYYEAPAPIFRKLL